MDNLLTAGLSDLPFEDLYLKRMAARQRGQMDVDRLLAPLEHRGFARDWVREGSHPWLRAAGLGVGIPGYQIYKMLGLSKDATEPSLDQLFAGYEGMFEGLR